MTTRGAARDGGLSLAQVMKVPGSVEKAWETFAARQAWLAQVWTEFEDAAADFETAERDLAAVTGALTDVEKLAYLRQMVDRGERVDGWTLRKVLEA